jgi:hypothetical protein
MPQICRSARLRTRHHANTMLRVDPIAALEVLTDADVCSRWKVREVTGSPPPHRSRPAIGGADAKVLGHLGSIMWAGVSGPSGGADSTGDAPLRPSRSEWPRGSATSWPMA